MKKVKYLVLIISAFLFAFSSLQAQSGLVDVPYVWKNVSYDWLNHRYIDLSGNRTPNYWEINSGKSVKRELWRVSPDRARVSLYNRPSGDKISEIEFGTGHYVLAESGDYVQLSGLDEQSMGWCNKKDLILWKTPLRDKDTGIELKAFMVNNFTGSRENLRMIMADKEKYQIFDGPGPDANLLGKELIYDVFFIFKYDNPSSIQGKGRYLVSQHYELSDVDALLGWVNEDRLTLWPTSLCLEPNFDEEALKERNKTGIISTVFPYDFGGTEALVQYREKGNIDMALVSSELRDPAIGQYRQEPRMYGRIFRYPVFNGFFTSEAKENCTFRTGVAGKFNLANSGTVEGFNDRIYNDFKKKRERLQDQMEYHNIIFVLDGTEGMGRYFSATAEVIRAQFEKNLSLDNNKFKYGAVVYGNEFSSKNWAENPESEIVTIYPLGPHGKDLARDLEKRAALCIEFGDPAGTEAVNFGLKKAVEMTIPNQTNIIVHIGNSPDNSFDVFSSAEKTNTTANDLGNSIPEGTEIHYIGFVSYSENVSVEQREGLYTGLSEGVLPELAAVQGNKFAGIKYYENYKKPEAPILKQSDYGDFQVSNMKNSPFQLKAYYLNDYSLRLFREYTLSEVDTCSMKTQKFLENLEMVVEDDSPLSDRASEFSLPYLELSIQKLLEENSEDAQAMREFSEWAAQEKVQLFVESGTCWKTDAMTHPLFKYVLFMSDDDLMRKVDALRDLSRSMDVTDADLRKKLVDYWKSIGETVLGGGKYKKITIDEMRERIYGIENLNIVKPGIYGLGELKISDIEDSKRLSGIQLESIRNHITESYKSLTNLLESDYYYQVEGSSTRFYWVPLEFIY